MENSRYLPDTYEIGMGRVGVDSIVKVSFDSYEAAGRLDVSQGS